MNNCLWCNQETDSEDGYCSAECHYEAKQKYPDLVR